MKINVIKVSLSRWVFGTALLLAAAFVVASQVGDFGEIGIVSIVIAALSAALFIQCIISLTFAAVPIPLGVLYYVFQEPFDLPRIGFWILVAVVALSSIGLAILLPQKNKHKFDKVVRVGKTIHVGNDIEDEGENYSSDKPRNGGFRIEEQIEEDGIDNNPSISVQFGATSRYIHSQNLETAHLECKFGSLEAYFDHANLSPGGAEVFCYCDFGSIVITVPRHWRVIDEINCTLGGVDANRNHARPTEDSPVLTVKGSLNLGSIEIRYV